MSTTPRLTFIGLYNYDSTLFDTLTLPEGINKMTAVITFLRTYGECPVLYSDPDFIKSMLSYWSIQNQEPISRIYLALSEEYNPLHNFDRHEEYTDAEDTDRLLKMTGTNTVNQTGTDTMSHTGTNTVKQTGTDTLKQSGTNTVDQTGTNTVKDDSERTINEETTTDTTTDNTISAYNSSTYQPDNKQTVDGSVTHDTTDVLDGTQLTTRNLKDLTTRNLTDLQTKDLTDQETRNLTDAETRNLQDQTTRNLQDQETTGRELTHSGHLYGNIGVTKSQEMAIDEVELRTKYDIYQVVADMLHRDFCLYLY